MSGRGMTDIDADYVLIHDGARPFVNQEIIRRCMLEVPESNRNVKLQENILQVSFKNLQKCIDNTANP